MGFYFYKYKSLLYSELKVYMKTEKKMWTWKRKTKMVLSPWVDDKEWDLEMIWKVWDESKSLSSSILREENRTSRKVAC